MKLQPNDMKKSIWHRRQCCAPDHAGELCHAAEMSKQALKASITVEFNIVITNPHFVCWLSHGGVDTVLSNDALLQHQCCCLGSSHGFFLGQSQSLMPVFLTMLWCLFFCCTITQVWHSHAEESNSHEKRFHGIDGAHNHKHISSLLCSTDNISCWSLFLLTATQSSSLVCQPSDIWWVHPLSNCFARCWNHISLPVR